MAKEKFIICNPLLSFKKAKYKMDLDFSGDYDYDERVCGETSSKSYTYNNESENIS